MSKLTPEQKRDLQEYVLWYKSALDAGLSSILSNKIHYFQRTEELQTVYDSLSALLVVLGNNLNVDLEDMPHVLPALKRVLIERRRDEATMIEAAKETTIHPELLNKFEEKIKPLDDLIHKEWIRDVQPLRVPRLTEYLSIPQIEKHYFKQPQPPREYDEKFHILQSPHQFLPDLSHYRKECELRGTSVVVAQVDIDNFKRFNTEYTHTAVDRRILPDFMRLLESHVFSHGYVYRYGGDEYALLLPSLDYTLATHFLDSLRRKIESLKYRGIEERATVSIGFCYLDPDSYLTDREAEERANRAMKYAKEIGGKNCVAGFSEGRYDDESLTVLAPKSGDDNT